MKIKTSILLLSFTLVFMNCKSEKETEMKEENKTELTITYYKKLQTNTRMLHLP